MFETITVLLSTQTQTGVDDFKRPIYEEQFVEIPGVLVAPVSSEDFTDELNLSGKKAVYQLAIPKGDTNDWADKKVKFFGETWKTIGYPIEGIEGNIPLSWNKKVKVERYG